MNEKKIRIFLIILASFVWILIIWKIFNKNSAKYELENNYKLFSNKDKDISKIDSFEIQTNYKDPFLKNSYYSSNIKPKVKTKITSAKEPKKVVKKPKNQNIPNITYKGLIKSKNQKTGNIIYNQKSQLITESKSFE